MMKNRYMEIFIFVAGSTPQIVTETICCLVSGKPGIFSDEIYIITTNKGKKSAVDFLINKDILKELANEYKIPGLKISDDSFVIPVDSFGNFLEDIRDCRENEIMGDLITEVIRDKTRDPRARIHASIAGGRKTMSFYLGAAMQLFARPHDKLYHVLVSPKFESSPGFFYKPKKNKVIEINGEKLNTKDAKITLAELPFIRLREKLSLKNAGFKELVKEGQREIDTALAQPELQVMFPERSIKIGQKIIKLLPFHLVVYAAYLKKKLNGCKHPGRQYCADCSDCFPSLLDMSTKASFEEMAKDYIKMSPSRADDLLVKYKDGADLAVIRQAISKIKRTIGDALGDEVLTACYAITSARREYANTRHGVRVEKGKIKII